MSKGSAARPLSIPREQFDTAFDAIFGKKEPVTVEAVEDENEEKEKAE